MNLKLQINVDKEEFPFVFKNCITIFPSTTYSSLTVFRTHRDDAGNLADLWNFRLVFHLCLSIAMIIY